MELSERKEIDEDILKNLIDLLPKIKLNHSPTSDIYIYLSKIAKYSVNNLLGPRSNGKVNLGALGEIEIPFFSMGAYNTTHLFGLDELILFSFYAQNKFRYKKVADLGANIGLHLSLIHI